MRNRKFSALHAVAVTLWVVGFLVTLLCAYQEWRGYWMIGGFLAAVGFLLNVRVMLWHMEDRELRAFELGREVERSRMKSVN